MAVNSGLPDNWQPTVYRDVTAGTLVSGITGAPKRCAAYLLCTSAATAGTVTVQGPDGVTFTITTPVQGSAALYGNFSTIVAATNAVVLAGWVDDGSVQLG